MASPRADKTGADGYNNPALCTRPGTPSCGIQADLLSRGFRSGIPASVLSRPTLDSGLAESGGSAMLVLQD